jgi:hypothetical protein
MRLKSFGAEEVQRSPRVYVVFWGSGWASPALRGERDKLTALFRVMGGSSYESVLTQYYDVPQFDGPREYITADSSFAGSWISYSNPRPISKKTMGEVGVVRSFAVHDMAAHGVALTPETNVIVAALPGGARTVGGCSGFNYNIAAGPASVSYIYSGGRSYCSSNELTRAAAHEWAESVTDASGHGWNDSRGQEIADECEKMPSRNVGFPSETRASFHAMVPALWSVRSSSCVY